jgi:3-hydroxybutyryl-CoA dehydrogenase
MQLAVLATDEQWNELKVDITGVDWLRAATPFAFNDYEAGAFFILTDDAVTDFSGTEKPVFINSVTATLQQLASPPNVLRINGWNSFLQRPVWEVAGVISAEATSVLQLINKKTIAVNDEPGFIADKAVAMIINEAYFALGDNVSDKIAIDTAMKLGTNYPYGPFEWAEKIGLKNIFTLLKKLSETDKRYKPASALIQQAAQL